MNDRDKNGNVPPFPFGSAVGPGRGGCILGLLAIAGGMGGLAILSVVGLYFLIAAGLILLGVWLDLFTGLMSAVDEWLTEQNWPDDYDE